MDFNPFDTCRYNYNAASNDVKLVHWLLMGGLLHLVEDLGGRSARRLCSRCIGCCKTTCQLRDAFRQLARCII